MEKIYEPSKNLSIDESMVLWRGRLIFRQYIKNKKHEYGVKIYMLAEPWGLIHRVLVYSGQVYCYANASLQVIFNCTHILKQMYDNVLKKLAYLYTSQVYQISVSSIGNQIGHPTVNIEQQDASEFISALVT
jgi:hypothetical protein